jgi:hypothetical protein
MGESMSSESREDGTRVADGAGSLRDSIDASVSMVRRVWVWVGNLELGTGNPNLTLVWQKQATSAASNAEVAYYTASLASSFRSSDGYFDRLQRRQDGSAMHM